MKFEDPNAYFSYNDILNDQTSRLKNITMSWDTFSSKFSSRHIGDFTVSFPPK